MLLIKLGICMNPLYMHIYGLNITFSVFHKDDLEIKQHKMVDLPLNKEAKSNKKFFLL